MRLDHLLSREAPGLERSLSGRRIPRRRSSNGGPALVPANRSDYRNVDRTWRRRALLERRMLLSFERPDAEREACASSRTLKTAQHCQQTGITACSAEGLLSGVGSRVRDHRQDRKGTWWMPWHQESMKGVNGCDKPRVGAE